VALFALLPYKSSWNPRIRALRLHPLSSTPHRSNLSSHAAPLPSPLSTAQLLLQCCAGPASLCTSSLLLHSIPNPPLSPPAACWPCLVTSFGYSISLVLFLILAVSSKAAAGCHSVGGLLRLFMLVSCCLTSSSLLIYSSLYRDSTLFEFCVCRCNGVFC